MGIGEFLRTIGQIMWDSLTSMGQNMADALRDTDYAGAMKAAFQGAIDFLLTLGGYFATLIIEAGKQVVAAILGWDVYNTLVNLFSEAIETVIGKINNLISKLKEAWQAFKELIGLEEQSILARTDLGPQTPREKSQAAHRLFQQNAQRLKHEARAAELDAYRKNNPQLDALLRRAEQHTQKSPLTTPPLRKPQAANTQTVNIHINADGMGNKEAAALIGAEIKKEMAALDRKQKAAARSAFYDAHA